MDNEERCENCKFFDLAQSPIPILRKGYAKCRKYDKWIEIKSTGKISDLKCLESDNERIKASV